MIAWIVSFRQNRFWKFIECASLRSTARFTRLSITDYFYLDSSTEEIAIYEVPVVCNYFDWSSVKVSEFGQILVTLNNFVALWVILGDIG